MNQRTPDHYSLDSASNTCRQHPALCAKMAGEPPVVPPAQMIRAAASTVEAAIAAVRVLDDALTARIRESLAKCADDARSEILCRRMNCQSPTREQCNQKVSEDTKGQPVTLAMLLGREMHEQARKCAQQELSTLRPGGFSLNQRYRYDPESEELSPISTEEEQALLHAGRGKELLGTVVPDVVLHSGDTRKVQQVYDFKFPCVNTDKRPESRRYPEGHPHQSQTQEEVYEEIFKVRPLRVVPRIGIIQ